MSAFVSFLFPFRFWLSPVLFQPSTTTIYTADLNRTRRSEINFQVEQYLGIWVSYSLLGLGGVFWLDFQFVSRFCHDEALASVVVRLWSPTAPIPRLHGLRIELWIGAAALPRWPCAVQCSASQGCCTNVVRLMTIDGMWYVRGMRGSNFIETAGL